MASLAFNVLLVVNETVFAAASGLVGAATGRMLPATRATGEIASIGQSLDEQRRLNRELNQEAAKAQLDLATERQINREIRGELAESALQLAAERKLIGKLKGDLAINAAEAAGQKAARERAAKQVTDLSRNVAARLATAAKRETSVMAGEAIPGWGVAFIVAATSVELYDLCQTAIDMRQIEAVFSPEVVAAPDELTICAYQVPSKKKLWDAVVSAPGAAWDAAMRELPDLSKMGEMDWSKAGANMWTGAVEMGEQMVGGATEAAKAAAEAIAAKNQQFLKWLIE